MTIHRAPLHKIDSIADFLSRDSAGLAHSIIDPCPICGRKHPVPFDVIQSGPGLAKDIPALVESILGSAPRRPVLIFDQAIEEIINNQVIEPLRLQGLAVEPFPMRGEPGHMLDSGVENGDQAAAQIGPSADFLIGAGSGVVSDLTKWIATRLERPFLICGTAPSMNGHTSITATMTENDIKLSKFLNPANAVVMDIDILREAPMDMIQSGMGDLAARAVCNADWKLSGLLRKTSFCPLPYQMTAENQKGYLGAVHGITQRDPQAIGLLSEAVLLSGLSMTIMEGETSPSSGAEHVLSHFWDLLVHLRNTPKNFHGTQVGVGTIIMLNAYQYLREIDPSRINPKQVLRSRPALEEIEIENQSLYGDKAVSFNQVAREKRIPDAHFVDYLTGILDSWDQIWDALDPYITPVETIRVPFDLAGVPYRIKDIQRTPDQAREALLHGSHYRPRYTLLDLLWELGLFPQAADDILERSGVLQS